MRKVVAGMGWSMVFGAVIDTIMRMIGVHVAIRLALYAAAILAAALVLWWRRESRRPEPDRQKASVAKWAAWLAVAGLASGIAAAVLSRLIASVLVWLPAAMCIGCAVLFVMCRPDRLRLAVGLFRTVWHEATGRGGPPGKTERRTGKMQ